VQTARFAVLFALLLPFLALAGAGADIQTTRPARRWEEAFLTGNGRMGAMVFGELVNETIVVNHCRMYLPRGSREIVPDLGTLLPKMKAIGLKGGPGAVHAFLREKAAEVGHPKIIHTDPFHPAFFLKLKTAGDGGAVRNYAMTCEFATGEVAVRWDDDRGAWERRLFASRTDNVVALSVAGPRGSVSCTIAAEITHGLLKADLAAADGWITGRATYVKGKGGYDIAARVVPKGGKTESAGGTVTVSGADGILLLMRVEPWVTPLPPEQSEAWVTSPKNPAFAKTASPPPKGALKESLPKVAADYATLLARHAKVHGDLYRRVSLDLGGADGTPSEALLAAAATEDHAPPELMEKMYDACRYLSICSTGEVVPNLQGIWTGTWSPAWSGDWTLDSNIQLEINSLLSSNLPELMEPYFDLVESWLPDARTNARKLYGCRGIITNARASNTCLLLHWGRWPGEQYIAGAGWLAHYFYDTYLFTGDRSFLAKRVVPLLKETALFYEDLLAGTENADGKYRFFISYSPELGLPYANATFDIAVAREVLTNLIAACTELGIEADSIPRWRAMLDRMPPYLIGKDGALKEWSTPEAENGRNYNHRHYSFLYPLGHSYEFSREKTPRLWKACEVALEKKAEAWLHGTKVNSNHITHGMMNHAQNAARLGQGEAVHEILSRMTTREYLYQNFMIGYWPGPRGFGFDAVGTIPEMVNNALVFGLPGLLEVLPALPKAWPKGSVRGLLARGQIRIEKLAWDIEAGTVRLTLVSGKDQTLDVRLPGNLPVRDFKAEGAASAPSKLGPNARRVAVKADVPARLTVSLGRVK
jgi:hypothetical protein